MSEENIPNQSVPESQPIVPVVQEVTPVIPETITPKRKIGKPGHGILRSLPLEVQEDMEQYMRAKNSNATALYMKNKYGEQFPALKGLSTASFYQYFKKYNVTNKKELKLQSESVTPPPELLQVIEKITDPDISLSDKRAALTALFNACEARSKMLQERQTNFIDPALEALILANRKEQRIIIEKVAVLNDQLTKESSQDWIGEASSLVQVILSAVYNSYRLVHTDQSNFSMFSSTLGENLTSILKNYKSAKEQLKKETK